MSKYKDNQRKKRKSKQHQNKLLRFMAILKKSQQIYVIRNILKANKYKSLDIY